MKLLLDTCTFLWLLMDSPRLSDTAVELFREPANDVFLSSVSTWEIGVKQALGRLELPSTGSEFIPEMREAHGIQTLALEEESTLYISRLPDYHRDPFDRMLVCQAIVQNLTILSPDEQIRRYPVKTKW